MLFMIIDMHTHIFPEKIASRTIAHLGGIIQVDPHTNGMVDGLTASMKEAGIDLSVILPVVTKPSQFESINRFAMQFRGKPLYSLGGIHPASENYKEELRQLKEMGFIGIKFHPDYQEMYFNDIRMKHVIDYASQLGFIIVTHAGNDPLSPENVHGTPKMIREVLRDVQPEKMVLAHMGGNDLLDDIEEYILGENVYLDTGYVLDHIPEERMLRMFRSHSVDKILFATDSPWAGQKEYVEYMKRMKLTEEEREKIFWKNAADLLKINIEK